MAVAYREITNMIIMTTDLVGMLQCGKEGLKAGEVSHQLIIDSHHNELLYFRLACYVSQ